MEGARVSGPRNLIIIGGGEHARVVAEAAGTQPEAWNVVGFVDCQPCPRAVERLGLRQLAGDEEGLERARDSWFVLGIGRLGSATLRRQLVARYSAAGARWATVVHSETWISPTATLRDGAVVLAGATVNTGATLGAHSVVNTGTIIEHDVTLGDYAMAAPGVVVGGGTEIEDDCYLGLGCRLRDHIRIGCGTVVGMGAVVVRSLPAGVTAVGMPAKVCGGT